MRLSFELLNMPLDNMKLDDVIKHCRRLKHTTEDVKWGSVLAFSII